MTRFHHFLICLAVVLAAPPARVFAQYSDFSTTADGSILYFATTLPRSGLDEPQQGRIYTIDAAGLRLFASRDREDLPPDANGLTYTNYYALSYPEVSADGKLVAITGNRDCRPPKQCGIPETSLTTITGPPGAPDRTTSGRVRFSPNGKYALRTRVNGTSDSGGVLDLATGVTHLNPTAFVDQVSPLGTPIADDGTVISGPFDLELIRLDQGYIPLVDYRQEISESAVIDAAASVVVYSSRWSYPYAAFSRIRVVELADHSKRTLVEGAGDFWQPIVSHDGQRVLFLTNATFDGTGQVGLPQAYVIQIDGSGLRAITNDEAGIQMAILSGDGRVAYALTYAGRVLRIDVEDGVVTELLPRTLSLSVPRFADCVDGGQFAAGSLHHLSGVGYRDANGAVEPFSIGFNGREAPVVESGDGGVWFQVPWETANQNVSFNVDVSIPPGPFRQPVSSYATVVVEYRPCILVMDPRYGTKSEYGFSPYSLGIHQDFSGVITPDSPTHPGEIVNVYAVGLGPVDPPVPTGGPAPVSPLSRVTHEFQCKSNTGDIPVLFAGLAPGLTGLYQMQFQIPADLPPWLPTYPDLLAISCSDPNGNNSFQALLPISYE